MIYVSSNLICKIDVVLLIILLSHISAIVAEFKYWFVFTPFYLLISEVSMLLCRSLKLLQPIPLRIMTSKKQWVSYYNGPETDVEEICQQFSKFEGGKIELSKDGDTGIATITINHTNRKNALSGK